MKKSIFCFILFLYFILFANFSYANNNIEISLEENIIVNNENISEINTEKVYLSEVIENNIKRKIININEAGNYIFKGAAENTQISINAENINNDINIILDNASFKSENVPVIYVYSNNNVNNNWNLKITSKDGTENYIYGEPVENYNGAISSAVSIIFEGNGTLNINSNKGKGIESKKDITVKSGSLLIKSFNTAIEATEEDKSKILIENGFVYASAALDSEDGYGIYSSGTITVKDGKVYAIASENDFSSIEAKNGVFVNGGTIIGIGTNVSNMQTENNTNYMELHTQTYVRKNETLVLVNTSKEPIFAYKTDRICKVFIYTSPEIQKKPILLYGGSDIKGEIDKYGLYTKIEKVNLNSFVKHEDRDNPGNPGNLNGRNISEEDSAKINKIFKIGLIVAGGAIFIIMVMKSLKDKKGIVNLIVGVIIGVLIGFGISQLIIGEGVDITKTNYERETEDLLPELPDMLGDVAPPGQGIENSGAGEGGAPQRPNGFNASSNR